MPETEPTAETKKTSAKPAYPPLTPEQEKAAKGRYVWRYVYPGIVLAAIFVLPYETSLVAGIGMLPYAVATFLLSLKPSLALVCSMQSSRHEPLHAPVDEAEAARYRTDGKILAVFLLILTVIFFVLWYVRKSRAA